MRGYLKSAPGGLQKSSKPSTFLNNFRHAVCSPLRGVARRGCIWISNEGDTHMSHAHERFRRVISGSTCVLAANIFDPLSARIADMLGYEVCVLSGSVGKAANLGGPDIVLYNMSDVVDHCRRITRMAEGSLMVDAEDGFGNAVNVRRTVQEMEAAGVAAIEIEDNVVPKRFNVQTPGLVSKEEQVGKRQGAVAARTDPSTVIVARTSALAECPLEEALDRIRAYATTGAEALMLAAVPHGRTDIAAVHQVTSLPATASAEGAQLNGRPSPSACSILLGRRGTTRPSWPPTGCGFSCWRTQPTL